MPVIPNQKKGRILIMDDEESIRALLGEMVVELGYEPEFARDGAEAIEVYKRATTEGKPFKGVIMDLTVPGGMGGKDAVRGLLEIDPQVRAIISSGYSSDSVMADYRKYGFAGVVAKPYEFSVLARVLEDVLAR
jgi:CheY-like chemotaxis protein